MDSDCNSTGTSWFLTRWFSLSRSEGFPTRYTDQFSAAHVDVLTAGLIVALIIITLSLYLTLPGLPSGQQKYKFAYITTSLLIGGIVIVGNFGHEWEVSHVSIRSPYRAGTGEEIKGTLGLHVALRGINITLKANPEDLEHLTDLKNETIDYNEHFSWEWEQGRFGFGPYAGRISREFREAVLRGVPFPILQVAEYFTFDGEGIRFGRHYRQAGWYAHIMMWAAFLTWLMANILIGSTINGGALFLFLTGLLQLIAIAIWTCLRNPIELNIPFEAADGRSLAILSTKFGPDYYTVTFNGLLCVVLSFVIFVVNETDPDGTCKFFGIDPSTNFDEYYEHEDTKSKAGPAQAASPKLTGRNAGQNGLSSQSPALSSASRESGSVIVRRRNVSVRVSQRVRQSFRVAKPVAKPRRKHLENPSMRYKQKPTSVTTPEATEMTNLLKPPQVEVTFSSDSEDHSDADYYKGPGNTNEP